jgi:hypothetical protein
MLAYVATLLQCVMLCYSVVNSKYTACGGRSSVTLILLLVEDPTSVIPSRRAYNQNCTLFTVHYVFLIIIVLKVIRENEQLCFHSICYWGSKKKHKKRELCIYDLRGTETEYSECGICCYPACTRVVQRPNELQGWLRMDVKLCGGVGKRKGLSSTLNKFKCRIVCTILEFVEYFPHLFIIPFKRIKALSFGLYFNYFQDC